MDISKLEIDRSLKKKLNHILSEFEASKIMDTDEKSKSFFQKFFS